MLLRYPNQSKDSITVCYYGRKFMNSDWRDGFLFVGNQLSLDFLNTRPRMDGGPVELLSDCAALARWLKAAGLVSAREAKRLEKSWSAQPAFVVMLRELR